MTVKEIQDFIFNRSGLKTSVKKGTGSMKGYLIIWPMFQNELYPSIPFDIVQELKEKLSKFDYANYPVFCSTSEISIYNIEDNRVKFKTENKPKNIENMKVKQWGSKNSQMRLDKATAKHAKNSKKGNTVRYY